jgi:hypothetical protein
LALSFVGSAGAPASVAVAAASTRSPVSDIFGLRPLTNAVVKPSCATLTTLWSGAARRVTSKMEK